MARSEADIKRKLGKRIRQLRKERGLRQVDLDDGEYNVSLTFVQAIERGNANPSLITLFRISKSLGIRLKDLMNFD